MERKIRRRSPFWSLAGPLLGYWGIQIAVQFVLQLVIEMPYIMRAYASVMAGEMTTFDEIMSEYWNIMTPALEKVLSMQVEITGAAALCTLIMTGILFSRDRKLEQNSGMPVWKKAPAGQYWTIGVFGIVGCIGVTCLSTLAQAAFLDVEYQQTAAEMYSAPFLVQLAALGIVIPIAEEMMFRGVMFRRYRENRSLMYSALWSSLFFSLMHTNSIQMVYSFLLGILLAYIYEKFGSVKAPVLLHVLLNTGSVVFTELGLFDWLASGFVRIAAGAIVSAFVCSIMFVIIQKMEGAQEKKEMDDHTRPGNGNGSMDFF